MPCYRTRRLALYQIRGDQQAIDRLVERRPKLAGQIGDLFIEDKDKDWPRAVKIYSRGITAETTDVLLLSKRARAYEALQNWDAAAADWSRAATGNPEGAKLLAEFARRLAAGGQVPLANGQFEKSQALYERSLEADPENDVVAAELAQLLLDKYDNENSARWTVLKPTEMKSAGGATLTLPSRRIGARPVASQSGHGYLHAGSRLAARVGQRIETRGASRCEPSRQRARAIPRAMAIFTSGISACWLTVGRETMPRWRSTS